MTSIWLTLASDLSRIPQQPSTIPAAIMGLSSRHSSDHRSNIAFSAGLHAVNVLQHSLAWLGLPGLAGLAGPGLLG